MRHIIVSIVIVVVAVLAGPARADDRTKAEQFFRAGAQAFKQQRFAAAADQFEQAYLAAPLPEIAFSAAQAYRREYFIDPQPRYVHRAVELYRKYLAAVKSGGRRGDASEGLAEMQRELDKLTERGAKIDTVVPTQATRFAISVTVAGEAKAQVSELSVLPATDTVGATAKLDGKPVDMFVPIDVTPGEHTIEVDAPGYFPQTVKRRAVEGVTDLVEIDLKARPGTLVVKTEDDAEVAVNGRPIGTAPMKPHELAAGEYTVSITRRGRRPQVRTVKLERGKTQTLEVGLAKTGRRKAVPFFVVGAGVFAITSGITTALAVRHDGRMTDIENKRIMQGITEAELDAYGDATRKRDRYSDLAWGTGGVAVAAGATALLLYIFDKPGIGEAQLVPTASAGATGAALVGRF